MLDRRRKFAVAASALLLTFVLALLGIVEGPQWVQAVSAVVGLYGAAEAAEGFAHSRSNRGDLA